MDLRFIVLGLCIVGILADVPTPKTIEGGPAYESTYPYIISLQYRGSHYCGGSIVHKNYVITAAHCVEELSASSLTIKAGINKLSSPGHIYKVLKIKIHKDYNTWKLFNDVAILEVEEIDLGLPNISTIFTDTEFVEAGEPLALVGWGTTRLRDPVPDDLQHILLVATSVEECQAVHKIWRIRDTQICTLTKVGENPSHGYSGGPLLRRVVDGERLVGIVSWGTPHSPGKPDVFGRVSSFAQWFNDNCNNCLFLK